VGYSVVNIDEIEGAGPGGAVRFVRRGQEEVNVVVRGSGVWRVDGEEVPVREGSFLRFDPGTTRCAVAGSDGMAFIGVGARRGSYEPHGPF
jgi:mannose-6-phosphate isomerase-like protein (cupin superfamily)